MQLSNRRPKDDWCRFYIFPPIACLSFSGFLEDCPRYRLLHDLKLPTPPLPFPLLLQRHVSFLRRPVVHHGHSCRLLRAYTVHVVVANQELIVHRYLLPVLQIHSSDDRFNFVVDTSNDVSDSVCRRLRSEGLQQPRVHQDHFRGVLHLL